MDEYTALKEAKALIDEAKFGILATIDTEGVPHQRWMSPVRLPRFPNSLFCVTSDHFGKIAQLEVNPRVSWIFQSIGLDRVVTVQGRAEIVRDPMLAAEAQETIGPRLRVFWKYAEDPSKLVVVKTDIEEYLYFIPLKSIRERVRVKAEDYEH